MSTPEDAAFVLTRVRIEIRHRPSAMRVVAVFVSSAGAWITPSSEICSIILIFLILSLHLLDGLPARFRHRTALSRARPIFWRGDAIQERQSSICQRRRGAHFVVREVRQDRQ